MADYAIHDTTLIGTSSIIRKKEGSSALIDPADYPKRINLMGMLEEKTASSASICSFSDGASEVPLKNWLVTLPASLSGYSEVNGVRSGKNLFDKNNPNEIDGYITTTGFSTGNTNAKSIYIPIKGGATYTVSKTAGQRFQIATAEVPPSNNAVFTSRVPQSGSQASLTITAGASDTYLWAWIFLEGTDTGTLEDMLASVQIEVGSSVSAYEAYEAPTTYTASLGRTIYGGTADIVTGEGEDENGNAFTFTPITPTPETALGVNNFWADEGDTECTYRSSGTVTPVPVVPTLITKTITENGTYYAEDDDADGYSSVTVNVQGSAFTPAWSETKIVNNTSLASSITFTEDYHNYDMIKIVIYNSSSQIYDTIFADPAGIDKAFTYSSNHFCVNQQVAGSSNQYACYNQDSTLTWSRVANRNVNIYEVYGITFTNCTLTKEVIYSRDAIASGTVTPTAPTGKTFFDYDAIIYMVCTTDANVTCFSKYWISKPKTSLINTDYAIGLLAYNSSRLGIYTETSIGTHNYFYVVGLKFTPTPSLLSMSPSPTPSESDSEDPEEEVEEEET